VKRCIATTNELTRVRWVRFEKDQRQLSRYCQRYEKSTMLNYTTARGPPRGGF